MTKVWLYSLLHDEGQIGNPSGGAPYEIVDHLVLVPAGEFADSLLNMPVFKEEFGGRYVLPQHAYRLATSAEIAAHVASHSNVADQPAAAPGVDYAEESRVSIPTALAESFAEFLAWRQAHVGLPEGIYPGTAPTVPAPVTPPATEGATSDTTPNDATDATPVAARRGKATAETATEGV